MQVIFPHPPHPYPPPPPPICQTISHYYTNDMAKIRKVTACIERIWNTRTAQGTMNTQQLLYICYLDFRFNAEVPLST